MRYDTPAAPAVRETLERVLRSETFGRSERARDLLRYLIDREQAGEAERLKGFTIAVDVFGKDAEFDPSTDAVVRVQAGRLRDLLEQYYASEGAGDPLRVIIPRGSYVPAYRYIAAQAGPLSNETGPADASPAPGPVAAEPEAASAVPPLEPVHDQPTFPVPALSPQLAKQVRLFWMAMGAVIAMLGFVVVRMALPLHVPVETGSATPESPLSTASITAAYPPETLPSAHISANTSDPEAIKLALTLRSALSGFDTIDLIARDHGAAGGRADESMDFIFSLVSLPSGGSVVVELQHAASGTVLMSRQFSPSTSGREELDDQIADMMSAAVPVSGVIYGFIEQKRLQSGLTECLLLNDDYYLDQTPARHRGAFDCFKRLLDEGVKSPLIYSEMAALELETITDGYGYPPEATLERGMDLAYRGVLAGPTSPYAHRAYGYLNGRSGNAAESIRWMRKAYELNTYDLSMAAAYGYALIFSGDYATGGPIMKRAVEASSSHPSWWDYALFLGEFMLGDMERAARATEVLLSTRKSHYLAARIIVAQQSGQVAQVAAMRQELAENYPDFAKNPRAAFEKANYPANMTEKLIEALRSAGLDSAN
ncbi:hypothetical protein MesoLjLc_33420 [Mesorhizobium sp. L-8-10]|uniref:tetratricopeptide repeat protein n=1 Tax=unclassified Mesorhizobium TaxID=325217 RepID=UPI0019263E76|nr:MULTISPECIES: hypothetical protein [unclassified Mesorhizobium]BCH23682.1 hypothetical protein MesoLjLb_34670 [Mesorhizobium sp. L-8-3]BCH31412.1 hypothetical protein MesoLjLc_33420 [Mesorhizobium sp. L-8-10]